ncbi:MAG: hypothetical protein ABII01_01715 [Candidatus Woesearchaeota archaeon]
MANKELMQEFEKEFEKIKKELGFKSNLDELDRIFFIKDHILKEGYVSNRLSRVVCRRIVDLFMSWGGYIHSIIMPNPSSMINMTENSVFDDKEKEDLIKLMNKTLAYSSRNTLIGLNKKKDEEAKFIDDSLKFWNKVLEPELTKIIEKVNKSWEEKGK